MTADMLIAYDAGGNVLATLDYLVKYDTDEARSPLGLIDFAGHEAAGGKLRDIWEVPGAAGSGTWPEWIGGRAYDFKVELTSKKITALVHKTSGHRRERAGIEAEIAKRIEQAAGKPADIRDVVGGPTRPLILDAEGKTVGRSVQSGPPAPLPLVGMTR